MTEDMKYVDSVIDKYGAEKSFLIAIFGDIQAKYNYLPKSTLEKVAERLSVPLSQAYHVATFYKSFSLKPKGKHIIKVCMGTACHVKGSNNIKDKISRDLHIDSGETTKNKKFTLEEVRCVGCCSLAPVVVIDKDTVAYITQDKISRLLKKYKSDKDIQ